MFVAGPPVVNRLSPRQFDKQELGGWEIQLRAGAIDEAADSEDEAFAYARRFLSYMPSSVYDVPARGPVTDDPNRREESLFDAIPRDIRKVYRIRPIVEKVVDQGSFFEMGKLYGRSVVTGFARVDGWPIAVMASDPMFYGGGWTADACQKVERFVDTAADLPSAGGLLLRLPRLPDRARGREERRDPPGRAGDVGDVPDHRAVVQLHHPQRLRRGRRGAPERRAAELALCLAVGPLGLAAARRRHRGGLPRRPRRRRRSARPRWTRSRIG